MLVRNEAGQIVPALVKASYVAELLGITQRSVRRLSRQGVLPTPLRIGRRMLRWRKVEVDEYAERAAQECRA